jgi:short-subunit dehydrogenase
MDRLLEALARELGGAEMLAADLTLAEDLARVEARIASAPELELLVNNAGFGTKGMFWETPFDAQERMHRLHVMATLRLTRAALAAMVPRGRGGVINVSSVAGFGQSPGNASYCATKAWMTSFTVGLDLELRGKGSPVRVQALCPGFTVTEFHDTMGMRRDGIPSGSGWVCGDVVDQSSRLRARQAGRGARSNLQRLSRWRNLSLDGCVRRRCAARTRGARKPRDLHPAAPARRAVRGSGCARAAADARGADCSCGAPFTAPR